MPKFRHNLTALAAGLALAVPVAAELEISGIEGELERNVRAFASLSGEACDTEEWLIRRRYRKLASEARKALEPFGHYEPVITTQLTRDERCWHAMLEIDPGEAVTYRNVDIRITGEAASDPAFAGLVRPEDKVTDTLIGNMVPGTVIRHADYDRLKNALQIRAADRGYVEARFTASRLDVWPGEGAADVTLHFDSGPRYNIGEIRVEQDFLDSAIVLGYVDLERGTPFDSEELARAHRDLSVSAYFGSIDVVPDTQNATNGEIPIRIAVQPGNRIEYTVGVGVSTDTGVRFRGGFRNNRLNDRGHRIIADLAVSPVIQGITVEYRIPLHDPRREWFSFTAGGSNEETDTFDNDTQNLGLRWTKAMSRTWLRTLFLDASNESFRVGETIDTSRLVVPGIMFDQKVSDRDVFPTRGRRFGMEIRGTDQVLGSTASYAQATAWLRLVRSFGTGNRILARFNAGATASADFIELPPSVRFFAGGDESIRGFDYNSLGPVDADGNVIGGTNLLVASLEYERHLWGNYYGAAFVDAGNAFDSFDFEAEVGAGIGFKWRSPIGPLRIYLGYPLTDDDPSVRLHLRLGADL